MLFYNLVITILLFSLFMLMLWNMYILRSRDYKVIPDEELPFISVLVPARNEEENIEKCLLSLLNQNYPRYEVIVYDDNSTDRTYEILNKIKQNYPHLQILKGEEPPPGWTGKNYACYKLSLQSKGERILFTDADTIHSRDSLRLAMYCAGDRNADLLSLMPYQITLTFSEKLVIPLLYYTTFTLLPFYFLEKKGFSKFTIAIGQFMLFKKDIFFEIGGYEIVKSAIAEDVWLGRKIKAHRHQLIVAEGLDILKCRMYKSIKGIWEGFSKNIFAGLNYSTPFAFSVILMYFVFNIAPYILFVFYLISEANNILLALTAVQILILYAMRLILSLIFKTNLFSVILHPFGIAILILIIFNSWIWVKFKGGSRWKNRIYKFSRND